MRYAALIFLSCIALPAAAAPRTAPDPQPEPQNQSIINTSKSNVKDFAVVPADPAAADGINTTRSNIKNSFRLAPGDPPVIATPIEIRFTDRAGYDDFAAGRIPLALVLRNAASGRTISFERVPLDGFRPGGDRSRVTLDTRIDGVDSALLARGCFETTTEAAAVGDGATITVTYTPCGGGQAQRAVNPIPGIGITVKKVPGHRLVVATGPSTVGNAAAAGLRGVNVIPLPSGKGNNSTKAQNF